MEHVSFLTILKANIVGKGTVRSGGKRYKFAIVKQDIEPKLEGFVGLWPESDKSFHFFIADEVLGVYRRFYILHEVRCLQGGGDENMCAETLKYELRLVPRKIRPAYIHYRRAFYQRLVAYNMKAPDSPLKRKITKGLAYLETLQ